MTHYIKTQSYTQKCPLNSNQQFKNPKRTKNKKYLSQSEGFLTELKINAAIKMMV